MNQRMDRSRFHIGAYCLQPYARTEHHIRELAECGINFVVGVERDPELLERMRRYGVGAVINGVVPGWFGGTGENAGTMAERNPLEDYRKAAERFEDHPAIWGIDVGDEPSLRDLPHYGKVMSLVEGTFANQFAYLNLYPSYGMLASAGKAQAERELGCENYGEYLRGYCENVELDYLCFDHYMYSSDHSRLIADLQTAAQLCRQYKKRLWVVLQVNSLEPEIYLSERQLCLQAWTAMAFGVECILWACYTAGWWYHQVLDENGEQTEQYEKLKRVNARIHALSGIYMAYQCAQTLWLPVSGGADWGTFRKICAANGETVLAGSLEGKRDSQEKALFLCAKTCADVSFVTDMPARFFDGQTWTQLVPDASGCCALHLPACGGGILLREG